MQSSSNGNAQARLRACFVPVCELAQSDTWQCAYDDITDQDLEGSDDADTSAKLLRKRSVDLALRWKTKTVAILKFTRGYDWRLNWHTETDTWPLHSTSTPTHAYIRFTLSIHPCHCPPSCPSLLLCINEFSINHNNSTSFGWKCFDPLQAPSLYQGPVVSNLI